MKNIEISIRYKKLNFNDFFVILGFFNKNTFKVALSNFESFYAF